MFHTHSFACFTCFKRVCIDIISVFLSDFKCAVSRAAVCDDDFALSQVVLVFNGFEAGCQCFGGVVGGDNDGDRGIPII